MPLPSGKPRKKPARRRKPKRSSPNGPPPAPHVKEVKWTAQDFAGVNDGHLPMGKATDEWSYGDLEEGFRKAALVLDDTFVTPNTYHQTLESRTAMAYWQNGKVFLHCSTQSVVQTVGSMSRWLHLDLPRKVRALGVPVSEVVAGDHHLSPTAA